ncbi:MAG: cation:proton antiporter [Candidatus Paceibacterota bacterium]
MEFIPFFLVLFVAVIFSAMFRKFHLPWVIALIIAGVVVGPFGFEVLEINPVIDFMAQIGLIFLMFMAGLETKLSSFKEVRSGLLGLSILNATVPFAVGFGIGWLFGFGFIASLVLGIIFISSSIAVIIPSLEANGLIHTKLGKSITFSVMIEDILSLVLLSVLLQTVDPITTLPLPLFYLLLFATLVVLRFLLPILRNFLSPSKHGRGDAFQQEVRIIFAILLGTVVSFELLGLHPIIAGFFAGLVLSDSIRSTILIEKLRTISYGLFIPIFFIVVGAKTDIGVFLRGSSELLLVLAVLIGSMSSKFISGWLGGRISRFSLKESSIIGVATIPSLSTTLAVAFTAVEFGLLPGRLITALVVLSMVSVFVSPLLLRFLTRGDYAEA